MKKYLFYMMTVAALLALGGCASNDEVIAETEDVQPEVTRTILARIDNSGNTRVAINGLKLDWTSGDKIGVVYQYSNSSSETVTTIAEFTYSDGTTVVESTGATAALFTGSMPSDAKVLYAYYPYNEEDAYDTIDEGVYVNVGAGVVEGNVVVPMLGTLVDDELSAFTFKAVGALLAVKVKNLPEGKYTIAGLYSSNTNLQSGIFTSSAYKPQRYSGATSEERGKMSLPYVIPDGCSESPTFYYPLPAGSEITGMQFVLQDDSYNTEYVEFMSFTPTINTKYVKAIELDADGKRLTDKITLTNCKLEATNTVVEDFKGMNGGMTANFKIPMNQWDNNEEKVSLTISNLPYEEANFIEGDEDFEGGITAKDVKIIDGGGNACNTYNFTLLYSNVTLDATKSGTTAGFKVKEARSFTIGGNITTGRTAKIDCQLEKLEIAGAVGSTIQLNANVSGELIIPDYSGAEYRDITLEVANGVSIEKISLGTGVRLYINYGGYEYNYTFETEVNGTKVTFDSKDKSCVVSDGNVEYGVAIVG